MSSRMLPNAKLLDNHLLIDPVAAVYDRSMPEYQGLRKLVRKGILDSISTSVSLKEVTWIFTDSQSSDEVGKAAVADYIHAAEIRGSPIISIILVCASEENLLRVGAKSRGKTKLNDAGILLRTRETENIHHFGGDTETEIDVTKVGAADAAQEIFEFIQRVGSAAE
ncbi:MAG: hypothetical protein L6R40_005636 [Gallowayella cf. fulva]|nr:MAG: hypothetical protein L6R40_005636 [Xanthomendoza cf. fulva]